MISVTAVVLALTAARALADVPSQGIDLSAQPADAVAPPAPGVEATAASAAGEAWHGFSFRLGGLLLAPLPASQEVELTGVTGPARLSVSDGPIPGSGVGMGSNLMLAGTISYALPVLDRQLAVETVLAAPFSMKLLAKGTLADESLAPTAVGNLPTGVPPLGEELGEVKVLPPVLTVTWRFLPGSRVRPYAGLGFSYLAVLEARITNPVLTAVTTPKLEVPNRVGWVLQGGVDVHLYRWFFATADLKFIGGLDLTAVVKDVYVRLPKLPLYEVVRVGDNVARVTVNPLVFQVGVGMNL